MFINLLLYAGLLPLIASASIAYLMRRLDWPPQINWPTAIACGFLVGRFALKTQTGFVDAVQSFTHPHEAVDWLPLIVVLALGVHIVMVYASPSSQWRTLALAVAILVATPVRLLSGNEQLIRHWSATEKLAYLALLAATLGVDWLLLATDSDENPASLRVPLLIIVAIGTAVVLTQSGVFVYGLSAGAVAAAISGVALIFGNDAWRARPLKRARPVTTLLPRQPSRLAVDSAGSVITFSLGSLIILGHFYAELTGFNAALLFLSLAATSAPLPEFIRRGPAWRGMAVRIAICILPLAVAILSVSTASAN